MYDSHIFLDFEMNPVPREARSAFPEEMRSVGAEIIEIGAVKLEIGSWIGTIIWWIIFPALCARDMHRLPRISQN